MLKLWKRDTNFWKIVAKLLSHSKGYCIISTFVLDYSQCLPCSKSTMLSGVICVRTSGCDYNSSYALAYVHGCTSATSTRLSFKLLYCIHGWFVMYHSAFLYTGNQQRRYYYKHPATVCSGECSDSGGEAMGPHAQYCILLWYHGNSVEWMPISVWAYALLPTTWWVKWCGREIVGMHADGSHPIMPAIVFSSKVEISMG